MTTKAMPSTSALMKGSTPRSGAASTPASPASAPPSAKVAMKTRSTLMPSRPTISALSEPARSTEPSFVRSTTNHSVIATSTAMPTTNSR